MTAQKPRQALNTPKRRITPITALTFAVIAGAGITFAINSYLGGKARETRFDKLIEVLETNRQIKNPPELLNPAIRNALERYEPLYKDISTPDAEQPRAKARIGQPLR